METALVRVGTSGFTYTRMKRITCHTCDFMTLYADVISLSYTSNTSRYLDITLFLLIDKQEVLV